MAFFFKIIDTNKERFLSSNLKTPLGSEPNTPDGTHPPTPSITEPPEVIGSSSSSTHSRKARRYHLHLPHLHLLSETPHYSHENLVGVFESQKYLDLEARMTHPNAEQLQEHALSLLAKSVGLLLVAAVEGLDYITGWLDQLNASRFGFIWDRKKRRSWQQNLDDSQQALSALGTALQNFREKER